MKPCGKPVAASKVSKEGFLTPLIPAAASGATGPATTGATTPPITSCTRCTTVPRDALGANHLMNCWNTAGLMAGAGHPSQMSWKVSCTHPPVASAWVTEVFRSASVQVVSTWPGALVLYAFSGGMVSATGQAGQLNLVLTSPRPRALLSPQFFTSVSTAAFSEANG